MKKVRTRYAPSPTGKLHIGGARTALFSYLFAKSKGGDFLIRIEDTDLKRNIDNGENSQLDGLEWMGVYADISPKKDDGKGPYRQSERKDIYQKYIDLLIEKNLAYKCYCTPEELEKSRTEQIKNGSKSPRYDRTCLHNKDIKNKKITPSIRFKVPENKIYSWNDGVRGKISVPSYANGDWVIQKSDGNVTYNFANVIDDHLMEVTDILRGEEHIANTPKQLMIYETLGWKAPNFYHLGIITNSEGKKLSKRDENTFQFIELFKQAGFVPEAVFNFLSLIGWNSKDNKEILSQKELIKVFDSDRFSKSPAMFDLKKLHWMNNFYIKKMDDKKLYEFLSPFVKEYDFSKEMKMKIFKLFQPQLIQGDEIKDLFKMFGSIFKQDEKTKDWEFAKNSPEVIKHFLTEIKNLSNWKKEEIKEVLTQTGTELKISGKNLMKPIRIATTRLQSGPDIASVLEIFGKDKTIKRLESFLKNV